MNTLSREQMNVVIVGHVDHGKSTLIGRLLADTGSLPKGKLEAVQENCKRTARPFEYAFLLDALKDEQSQGITIDTARSFFKSKNRDYIIIDAPGHIEFLKNMITGAARAEAAILVIDAKEGIRENSKRHGYMMSFLGIKNVTVCVNKMDLVNFDEAIFNSIRNEFLDFLSEINLRPLNVIPISAMQGENIIAASKKMTWYEGPSILEALDNFVKMPASEKQELRFPVQDVYKFTEEGDERRIFAGRIESGSVKIGDEVIFLPSSKRSRIASVEAFNLDLQTEAFAGQSTGFCLETQVYVKPGQIMCKIGQTLPHVSTKLKTNIFWMGKQPLVFGKTYKLKLATQHVPVVLSKILGVLDASELSSISNKQQVDRHDVAECILETLKPIAFDETSKMSGTGRFVIVDNYEISGGGIILAPVFDDNTSLNDYIRSRDFKWERSDITPAKRAQKYEHKSALIAIVGISDEQNKKIAKGLEERLFELGKFTYFLGIPSESLLKTAQYNDQTLSKVEMIKYLGEIAHTMTDAGLILLTQITDPDDADVEMLTTFNRPNPTLIVSVGENLLSENHVHLALSADVSLAVAIQKITELLIRSVILDPEYSI